MITEDWNEELGLAQCVITDTSKGITLTGYGRAVCHDNDIPWKSQVTGQYIALTRAQIDILRKKRDFELKPSIMAIKHVLATMVNSRHYNPKSYEAKRIKKELQNLETELHMVSTIIHDEQETLKTYLEHKESIYNSLRN